MIDTVFAACDKRSGHIKHTKFPSTNTINDLVAKAVYISRDIRQSSIYHIGRWSERLINREFGDRVYPVCFFPRVCLTVLRY